jgi:hypothetical protein
MHQGLICDATCSFSLATPHRREPSWHNKTFVLIWDYYTTLACTRQAIAWWLFIPTSKERGLSSHSSGNHPFIIFCSRKMDILLYYFYEKPRKTHLLQAVGYKGLKVV